MGKYGRQVYSIKTEIIHNKHVLLVDDVVTIGANIEACCNELLKAWNVQLSIATLCVASW